MAQWLSHTWGTRERSLPESRPGFVLTYNDGLAARPPEAWTSVSYLLSESQVRLPVPSAAVAAPGRFARVRSPVTAFCNRCNAVARSYLSGPENFITAPQKLDAELPRERDRCAFVRRRSASTNPTSDRRHWSELLSEYGASPQTRSST